jgi:hypothetical protein
LNPPVSKLIYIVNTTSLPKTKTSFYARLLMSAVLGPRRQVVGSIVVVFVVVLFCCVFQRRACFISLVWLVGLVGFVSPARKTSEQIVLASWQHHRTT